MHDDKPLTIAIVGLGMIGGSLAVGFKRYLKPIPQIIALDCNTESLTAAKLQQTADIAVDKPGAELLQADVVYLCTPVLQMEAVVASIAPYLSTGAIVTDVGSTKNWLAPRMKGLLPQNVHYIGGHPMAGREKSGFAAANGELLQNKWYLLCADETTDQASLAQVRNLAESLGAKVAVMDAARHDQYAAVISHTPHVAAAAMVNLLDCYPDPQTSLKLAGGGFHDTTRIASSDPDMWADICISNSEAILDSLKHYQGIIAELSEHIESGDRNAIRAFFAAAKLHRDSILQQLDFK